MRKLSGAMLAMIALVVPQVHAQTEPSSQGRCDAKCEFARDRAALRKKTTRHPIPDYIVACESGGDYRAQNAHSSAGGKYQILESTWQSYLALYVKPRVIRLAEGLRTRAQVRRQIREHGRLDMGPRFSSPLLQDIVAAKIWEHGGASQWSCS